MSNPGASPAQPSRLSRRLGLNDAVFIGLGSMIGAGVFAAIGPAAAAAGSGLLIGLGIAALVAYCNATSSAQLAAVYPESGGAYIYGRNRLGRGWGYLAGWMFVVGKTASCAAIALTFGAYVAPAWQRPLAVAAVVLLTSINYRGIQQTARTLRLTVAIVLVSLAAMIIAVLGGSAASLDNLGSITQGGWAGILESAGLLFFSFAGYARIATLAEEVADPVRTIPRAIPRALGIALLVYLVVAGTALIAIGPSALASAAAPLEAAVRAGSLSWSYPVVRLGAVVATLGVLLSLIAGVSRTVFAMASNRDLPSWLGAVHPIFRVPHRAELAVGAVICILVAVSDLRGAIGFSSFSVLLYYAVANASAWTLPSDQRRWPRFLAVAGVAGCLVLAATLPRSSVIVGLAVLALGVVLMSVTKELN
ncbi:MAG: amino acid permease [Actinobacteria bacterium]|nr:amino acid permease [Actinomycetota bacterium]